MLGIDINWHHPAVIASAASTAAIVTTVVALVGVYWGDLTDASCWDDVSTDCTSPHRVHCNVNEWQQRMFLVLTNALYLIAPCILYYQRRKLGQVWDEPDVAYTVVNIILCFMSSFHHLCDSSSNFLPCTTRCISTFTTSYWADAIAAPFVAHAAVMLGWRMRTQFERFYFLTSLLMYPFIALNLMNSIDDNNAYLIYALAVPCLDLIVRQSYDPEVTIIDFKRDWVWIAIAVVFGVGAVLLQYGTSFMWASFYVPRHTAWHTGTAIADWCAPVIFRRYTGPTADAATSKAETVSLIPTFIRSKMKTRPNLTVKTIVN